MSILLSNERTRPQKGTWFHWGSNPGPSACKADVITATLWNLVAPVLASDGQEGERGALGHADVCLSDVMTSRKVTCPRNRVRRRGKETGLPSVLCSAVFGRGRMGVDSCLASLCRAWTEFPAVLANFLRKVTPWRSEVDSQRTKRESPKERLRSCFFLNFLFDFSRRGQLTKEKTEFISLGDGMFVNFIQVDTDVD